MFYLSVYTFNILRKFILSHKGDNPLLCVDVKNGKKRLVAMTVSCGVNVN